MWCWFGLWLGMLAGGLAEYSEEDFAALEAKLESPSREKRKSAVRLLAALNTEEAWELVIGALSDPEGVVADEAEFRLSSLMNVAAAERLVSRDGLRSQDERVAIRASAVFGRGELPLPLRALSRGLNSRSTEVVLEVLNTLERRGDSISDPKEIARLAKLLLTKHRSAKDASVRGMALLAAASLARTVEDRDVLRKACAKAMRDSSSTLRIAALRAGLHCDADVALAQVRESAEESDLGVRLQAARVCRQVGTREAVTLLIERLSASSHPREQWMLVSYLQQLSGLKHRADPRPWSDWRDSLPLHWVAETRSVESLTASSAQRSGANLAGLPVLSDRVVFLVDFSGSLWMKRKDGSIRKEFADRALRDALAALPESARFNVIPYTSEPHPWRPRLVKATRRNKRDAAEWFEACKERGSGDFYEAARLALQDPEVDTILSFTDGLPTGGDRCRLQLLVPSLLLRARCRGVAFDTVLVDAPRRLHSHWRALAAATHGQVHCVDVD